MNKKILLDKIISYFIKEEKIPESLEDKISLWKDLVSQEQIENIPENILSSEDKFLRLELINRKLTDGEKLPSINRSLNLKNKYGDKLSLWKGDITTIYSDSIINPVTNNILKWENIDSKSSCFNVFFRSGMRLVLKCKSLLNENELSISDVLITRAYNLPCDYLINVVLPQFNEKLTLEDEKIISMSYRNALECAKNNMVKTVVVPSLFFEDSDDMKKSAKVIINVVEKYLDENKTIFDKVIFQVNKDDEYNIYYDYLIGDKDA
ncbi:MAG: macro domain-containing protein [Bacilli bacterium]|nr:macro domain-containing protein [Bacilli bacterium]